MRRILLCQLARMMSQHEPLRITYGFFFLHSPIKLQIHMYLEDVTWCQLKCTFPDHGGALPDPGEKMTGFFVTYS